VLGHDPPGPRARLEFHDVAGFDLQHLAALDLDSSPAGQHDEHLVHLDIGRLTDGVFPQSAGQTRRLPQSVDAVAAPPEDG